MMKIRSVYLAGGINGLSDERAKDWREEAKLLLPREIGVLDPMRRDYRGVEDGNVEAIVRGDLEDIDASDAIIANCARPSWGTAMEIHYATTRASHPYWGRRPIVAIVEPLAPVSPWLRYHTNAIVPNVSDAVRQIEAWNETGRL